MFNTKMAVMPRIASFSLERTLCINLGIVDPPFITSSLFIFLGKTDILHNVLHNWSISQGSSDKFYTTIRDRAFLTKNSSKFINGTKFKKSRFNKTMASFCIFLIRNNIVHQFGYFRKKPLLSCGQFVYFPGNDRPFYQTFSIIGAFLKAQVTNFIYPAVTALFDKKPLQNINGAKFKKVQVYSKIGSYA